MTLTHSILLALLGVAAGFINVFAGGGSILVVPFLIFLGLPANSVFFELLFKFFNTTPTINPIGQDAQFRR